MFPGEIAEKLRNLGAHTQSLETQTPRDCPTSCRSTWRSGDYASTLETFSSGDFQFLSFKWCLTWASLSHLGNKQIWIVFFLLQITTICNQKKLLNTNQRLSE